MIQLVYCGLDVYWNFVNKRKTMIQNNIDNQLDATITVY